jgi:prolyl-tRNA synthetase
VLAAEKEGKTELWLLMLRGDHELNEVKASKLPGLGDGFRFATEAEIVEHFGCLPGYLGPIGLKKPLHIVADLTVANMSDFVTGANQVDAHLDRRELGPRPAGTRRRGRPAQRGRR